MSKNQEEKWLLREKYKGVENEAFYADLERLRAGEPLGYIIGHVPFLDCQIYLDSRPLIPRPETEYWVEKAIAAIKEAGLNDPIISADKIKRDDISHYKTYLDIVDDSKNQFNLRVLDLCAGSGAIGVAVAKAVAEAEITFAEIDPTHLPTIEKNLKHNLPDYSNRLEYLKVIESDLFLNVEGKFDFILTNPPYIDPVIDRTEDSVKNHEPHLALYGGASGMEIIDRIIAATPDYLNEGGQLWIEHEPEQVEAIHKSAEAAGFRAITYKDQYGVERYSILTFVS